MGAFSNCKATLDYSQWNCDFGVLISENEDFSWSVGQHSLLFCSITLTQFCIPVVEGSHSFTWCPCDTLWSEARKHPTDKVWLQWPGDSPCFPELIINSPECPQHVGFKLWVSTFTLYFTISNSLVYEKWGCQPVVSWVLRVVAGNLWISLWINCQISCPPRILNLSGWQVETATEKSAFFVIASSPLECNSHAPKTECQRQMLEAKQRTWKWLLWMLLVIANVCACCPWVF
jgi:hypothetical protein